MGGRGQGAYPRDGSLAWFSVARRPLRRLFRHMFGPEVADAS